MDYQIKSHNLTRRAPSGGGFSLIELLVVIGIFVLLISLSMSTYYNMRSQSALTVATNAVVEAMRAAQSNAQAGKNDSKWGVEVSSSQVVIFKGNTYATRDSTADQPFGFSGNLTASGLAEVVFEKLTGTTSTTGTTTLTNGTQTKNININAKGTLTY